MLGPAPESHTGALCFEAIWPHCFHNLIACPLTLQHQLRRHRMQTCWGCGGVTAAAESGKAVLGPAPELPLAALCFEAIWLDLGPTLNWDTCNNA